MGVLISNVPSTIQKSECLLQSKINEKEFTVKTLILNRIHLLLVLTAVLIALGSQGSYAQTITASTPQPLTETTLDESVVTLLLRGKTFERSNFIFTHSQQTIFLQLGRC